MIESGNKEERARLFKISGNEVPIMAENLLDPRGDIKLQNDKKTFLLQPYFYQATTQGEKPETPLKVFSNFSRWAVTLTL